MALFMVWLRLIYTCKLPSVFLETLLEIHAVCSVTFFKVPCFSISCIASATLGSLAAGHRWGELELESHLGSRRCAKAGTRFLILYERP